MAAILATRFPHKPSELFAYQASIVWAEQNYEGKRWVSYDRQFRREALAWKDLNWSVPDQHLYNEAFTGRACSIPRCKYCLQDDHLAAYCPQNPNSPLFGWFSDPASWSAHTAATQLAPVHNAREPPTQRFAATSMMGVASRQGANTSTHATTAMAHMPGWIAHATCRGLLDRVAHRSSQYSCATPPWASLAHVNDYLTFSLM